MIKKLFPAFGTLNSILIFDEHALSILEEIKKCMLQIHQKFSFFDSGSEISQINQHAGIHPVAVQEDTFDLLTQARYYARETKGAFDVTAGSMSELWRKAISSAHLPTKEQIAFCKAHCDINQLELDKAHGTAFLREKGMKLDLGGIVKGYAADKARSMLLSQGIQNAQLNFGGTVVAIGKMQKVGIQNPYQKTGISMASIVLKNKAVVTSGSYERYFMYGGRRLHHIIDPRTGKPSCSGLLSVSLIGENAAMLDALATGVYCLGKKESGSILRRHAISAVFVTEDGSVQVTPELQGKISLSR